MTRIKFINLFGRPLIIRKCIDEIPLIIKNSHYFRDFNCDTIIKTEIHENNMKNLSFFHTTQDLTYLNIYPLHNLESFNLFNKNLEKLENGNVEFISNILVHENCIDDFVFKLFIKKQNFAGCYCINDDYQTKIRKIKKML